MTITTIPPGVAFVDALAAGLLVEAGNDPLILASFEVLLPTRRAARALGEAFLRANHGRPMLLPRMRAVDAVDEDELALGIADPPDLPPAIEDLERRFLLARLIAAMDAKNPPAPDQAVRLAADLVSFLDSVQIERLDLHGLKTLVPEDFAEHWQKTLTFLDLLSGAWPKILAERGRLDPQERINRLIDAQAEAWRRSAPNHPVIAAGSTGTRPATADLLAVVAAAPNGRLVLPGLDQTLDDESWAKLDPVHPQYGMKRLLDRLGVDRRAVRLFGGQTDPRPQRAHLLSEALRPAETAEAWRHLPPFPADTLANVTRLDAPTPREEAGAIALMLRAALETPGKTAALVTPDRDLARRVAAELERWDVVLDDSAGTPLERSEPGAFLRLIALMVAEDFSPHTLLAALKHPLAAGGEDAASFRAWVRRTERRVLRGPRPAPGLAGLQAALGAPDARLSQLAGGLAPFVRLMAQPKARLSDLIGAHVAAAEALAADHALAGFERLWRGAAGEALATFVAELATAAPILGEIEPRRYPALFDAALSGKVSRPAWGSHPRLFLWGPLEARLQHADRMILAGLNEGTWPPEAQADPWMSRPMRATFGLPLPERRIGLSAHDFAHGFAAPEVALTRSNRVDGTPTVPSRWLLRLDAVMNAAGLSFEQSGAEWLSGHAALDSPDKRVRVERPAPKPPVAARPRRLSVTGVETWMRDPYAIYARHILGLDALDPIDADAGAAQYGELVHAALEQFLNAYPAELPLDAEQRLLTIGQAALEGARPGLRAFWQPRFASAAAWVVARERERRGAVLRCRAEVTGTLDLSGPAGPFRLQARADRIDLLKDGSLSLIDYKTGAPPSKKEVAAGFAPQLPLEAAIAQAGGFEGIPAAPVSHLAFWRLKGGREGGVEITAGDDPAALAAEAVEGLRALIAAFDDPNTAYEARPHPAMAPRYSDTVHLARVKEWATAGEDEE